LRGTGATRRNARPVATELYTLLAQRAPSPVVELNRAVAQHLGLAHLPSAHDLTPVQTAHLWSRASARRSVERVANV
jgi:predicted RNA polymerase sigma factor